MSQQKEKLIIEEAPPIDYNHVSAFYLGKLLEEDLSIDDIKEYQNGLLTTIKSFKCDKYSCKMSDILMKEMIIINKLIEWIIIIEREKGLV